MVKRKDSSLFSSDRIAFLCNSATEDRPTERTQNEMMTVRVAHQKAIQAKENKELCANP